MGIRVPDLVGLRLGFDRQHLVPGRQDRHFRLPVHQHGCAPDRSEHGGLRVVDPRSGVQHATASRHLGSGLDEVAAGGDWLVQRNCIAGPAGVLDHDHGIGIARTGRSRHDLDGLAAFEGEPRGLAGACLAN